MSEQIDNAPTNEMQAASLPSVGVLLQAAREGRGLQVSDIAQALKLGQRQVEALERDDWSGLPGTTFIRGFVRNYARLVGIDPGPLMLHLDRLLEKPVDTLAVPEAAPTRISASTKSRDGLVVGLGVGLLVLAALAYFLLPSDLNPWRASIQGLIDGDDKSAEMAAQPVDSPQEALFPPDTSAQQLITPQATVLPGTEVPGEAAKPAETTVAAGVEPVANPQLRFVVAKESWLEVRDRDDSVVFSQRLPDGTEQLVGGKGPLSVTIGYAPGVSLFLRGQIVNLVPHTKGDVARLVLE